MKKFTFLVSMLLAVALCPATTFASDVLPASSSEIQGQNVSGVVVDTDGVPVIGATVIIEASGLGSITDVSGAFVLERVRPGDVVEVSSVGYKATTFTITSSQANYSVTMEIDGLMTDEVVVTAMGIERKASSLTYATQQVGNDEFSTAKDVNVINSLQGKTAGLVITPGSSGAGSSSKILMRGNKSATNSSTPLIVIDGIPMNNPTTSQPSGNFEGRDNGDALSNLNPDDIASINLLKGASAAALYGSMAANGVLMITTKKGAEGTLRISYSSNMTFETILKGPEIQKNYGATVGADGSLGQYSWGEKLTDEEAGLGSGRLDDFYGVGQTYINSVTITGGTEKIQSFFSYANTYAKGLVEQNDFNRHNIALRETFNLFNNRLSIDVSANYIKQDIANQQTSGTYYNALTGLYTMPNNADWSYYKNNYAVYNENSMSTEQVWYTDALTSDFSANPYWVINKNPSTSERDRVLTSTQVNLKLTDWLNINGRIAYDLTNDYYERQYWDGTSVSLNGQEGGAHTVSTTKYEQFYGDLMLNFNKTYGDWEVSASAGGSFKYNTSNSTWHGGNLTYTDIFSFNNYDLSTGKSIMTSSYSKERLNSVFATAQIGFSNYLYGDVSVRNDWSSCLAFTSTPSFFYPAGGLSFLLNEVTDMKNVDLFKIRASYSVVGNTITARITNPLNSITAGAVVLNTAAPFTELEPEKMHSFEAGFDLGVLDGKLNFEATYYKTNNKNQLFSISAPAGSGYSTYYINAGNIQNQGLEFTASYDFKIKNDWRWMTSINVSYNNNKIVKLSDDLDADYVGVGNLYGAYFRLVEGGSYGDIYGYDWERNDDGSIVVDSDGTPQKGSEQVYLGNMNSDWKLGWTNNIKYKNWNLSMVIDGSIGGQTYSGTLQDMDMYGVSLASGVARDNGGVDNGAGTLIDAQTYYTSTKSSIASEYIYSATNFRLRELTLGYTFRNIGGKSNSISIDFVGRNLFFLYLKAPKDPEQSAGSNQYSGADIFNLPTTRSFGLKFQFNF